MRMYWFYNVSANDKVTIWINYVENYVITFLIVNCTLFYLYAKLK